MDSLPFVRAEDVEGEERMPKRVSKLLLAPKNVGTRNVSMGLNVTAVGSMIPDHVHTDSEEVMYIISGRARLRGRSALINPPVGTHESFSSTTPSRLVSASTRQSTYWSSPP